MIIFEQPLLLPSLRPINNSFFATVRARMRVSPQLGCRHSYIQATASQSSLNRPHFSYPEGADKTGDALRAPPEQRPVQHDSASNFGIFFPSVLLVFILILVAGLWLVFLRLVFLVRGSPGLFFSLHHPLHPFLFRFFCGLPILASILRTSRRLPPTADRT